LSACWHSVSGCSARSSSPRGAPRLSYRSSIRPAPDTPRSATALMMTYIGAGLDDDACSDVRVRGVMGSGYNIRPI